MLTRLLTAVGLLALTLGIGVGAAARAQNLSGGSLASMTIPTAGIGFLNATSGTVTVAAPAGALGTPTVTLPDLTGSLGTGYSCGDALAANGACPNTALAGTFHFVMGSAVLAGGVSTITGITPAFSSSTSWWCATGDETTTANASRAVPASGSTLTFAGTGTDKISFVCGGN